MRRSARPLLVPVIVVVATVGCNRHGHDHGHGDHGHDDHEDDPGHGHGEGATAVTHFGDSTELFVEIPPLIVGQPAELAAHVTALSDWRPTAAGTVTVELSGGGGPAELFTVEAPSVPGIFRPQVTPAHAGLRTVTIHVSSPGAQDVHPCGELPVHADAGAAAEAAAAKGAGDPEPPGSISFLKEQAWKTEFAMQQAAVRSVRPSFEAYGTLRARSDGEAHVTAPVSGRLAAGASFPRIGLEVKPGAVLAVLTPRLAEAGDSAALSQATAAAGIALRRAEEERKRLEALFGSGAIPERRLAEGRYAEEQARQKLATAQRRQRQAQRFTASGGSGEGAVPLRAPMSGTIVGVESAPGAFVEEGDHLFRIVDLARLRLEVHVAEAHAAVLGEPRGVWFEVEGFDRPFEAGPEAVIAAGGELDARSRTIPLFVAVDNAERRLRVGMFADVRVITGPPKQFTTVPVTAVVREGGLPIVYAQLGGESFERRVVRLGARDGEFVTVLSGVAAGEWVVTTGAYAVRLAGAAPVAAGHGHPH